MALKPRKPRTPAQEAVTAKLVAANKKRMAAWKRKSAGKKQGRQSNPTVPYVIRLTSKQPRRVYYYRGADRFNDDPQFAIEFASWASAIHTLKDLVRRLPKGHSAEAIPAVGLPGHRSKNPVPPSSKARLNAAARLYEDFTGHSPSHTDRVSVPDVDTAFVIGDCDGVLYSTVRDGKQERYIHEFKQQARPLLCSSDDGQSLLLLGGGFQFTERGIVDD